MFKLKRLIYRIVNWIRQTEVKNEKYRDVVLVKAKTCSKDWKGKMNWTPPRVRT